MDTQITETVDHLANFFYNYMVTGTPEIHEHPMVETSWNPFSFLLVFVEKNVFTMVIFVGL